MSLELTSQSHNNSPFFKILKLIDQFEILEVCPFIKVDKIKHNPVGVDEIEYNSDDDDDSIYSQCSFNNIELYLDKVIPPTSNNKKVWSDIVVLAEMNYIKFDVSFDWNISLLYIISKICTVTFHQISNDLVLFPFDKQTLAWYTGELDDMVKTSPFFTEAMIKGFNTYVSRSRKEFAASTALFIIFFNYFFTTKPAHAWIEPFKMIYGYIADYEGNWHWKNPELLLHRITTVTCGDIYPYLWYEIMLIKTFGDSVRSQLCRMFNYICLARFYNLQAMFDTLFPTTLYVALHPYGYISEILSTWLTIKPTFWEHHWTSIVFYKIDDVPIPDFFKIQEEVVSLFKLLDVEKIEHVSAPTLYHKHLEKIVPTFKTKQIFKKTTKRSPEILDSKEYKKKLRHG